MNGSCPEIGDALLRYLEKTFPDQATDPRDPEAAMLHGQVTVVRHLRMVQQSQQEEGYVPT